MITDALKQTSEYKRILAAAQGGASCTAALFGLPPLARWLVLAALCEDTGRPALIICAGEAEATRCAEDLAQLGCKAGVFPSRDYMLRAVEGANHEYEYRRLEVLGNLVGGRVRAVCCSVEAALQYTVPREDFCRNTLTLKSGTALPQAELARRLLDAGYSRRFQVEGPGQFSVRGGIVDIYAPDMAAPARVEYWGDEIDTLHSFDIGTQRREDELKKIHISPAREVLFGDCAETAAALRSYASHTKSPARTALERAMQADLEQLDSGVMPAAMDKYLAVRYAKPQTIWDYFDAPIVMLNEPGALRDAAKALEFRFGEEIKALLAQGVLTAPLARLYAEQGQLYAWAQQQTTLACENFTRAVPDLRLTETISEPVHSVPPWNGELTQLTEDLQRYFDDKYAAVVLAGTPRSAQALARDLTSAGYTAVYTAKLPQQFAAGTVTVTAGHLSAGADFPFARFVLFTSRRAGENKPRRQRAKNKGLGSIADITPGDYVVHQSHGIGLYVGIQRLDLQGVVKDYFKIQYDKGDTLYVPVTQLDLISRYTAPGDNEKVKLARMGGAEWKNTKTRVRAATQAMAAELIDLYAKRRQAKGHAFLPDGDWQRDFETRFAYDETEDQLISTAEIKKDMEKPVPMDRLLCGDVGVGKTEVALRAAFKCVMGGKQAAILVPTTILAWQHYNTLLSRMEAFPIKIGLLNRFRTPAQQRQTVRGLADGTVDIVVGTHRLLQKDVRFKDLGLVIIDEEQRFGVKHKEKLRETFVGVDTLTLSATPIPRTLNMAMSGIRDMSTIEQPPFERRPVETYVLEHDEAIIADALKKELARSGQAYYIHNRIDTIESCAARLQTLLPDARIATAHGRMAEEELSRVWQQLLDGEIDILVCTTLIETGVDVRNCNTLIIENADRMGLSQLYQLRGRVGRSGRKAYAYFTFERDKVLNDIAAKRLSAIREFTSFGSGFRIAMRDLQIRGAGSLLGKSQHGHMEAVGYDMYIKLLNQAIAELRGEPVQPDKADCLVDITADAYIPESYIGDAAARIEAYKRIAAIQTPADALDVTDELIDRYGDVPSCVKGLIDISLVRVQASKLQIYEIAQKQDTLLLYSDALDKITIAGLLAEFPRRILVNAGAKPYISVRVEKTEPPVQILARVIGKMSEKAENA